MTDVHDAEAAQAFRRQSYLTVPALIEPGLAAFLHSYVRTKFASLLLSAGDAQLPNTPSRYGDPTFDGLLEFLRPRIERLSGLALHPTFSYFRLYKRGDVLGRHRDRPACEISVSLAIGQVPAAPWPLHIETPAGTHAVGLMPGDALVYRGIDCFHWREAYPGEQLVQAFLHYVDRDGPHAGEKFDGRPTLMRRRPGEASAPAAGDT